METWDFGYWHRNSYKYTTATHWVFLLTTWIISSPQFADCYRIKLGRQQESSDILLLIEGLTTLPILSNQISVRATNCKSTFLNLKSNNSAFHNPTSEIDIRWHLKPNTWDQISVLWPLDLWWHLSSISSISPARNCTDPPRSAVRYSGWALGRLRQMLFEGYCWFRLDEPG